MLVSLSQMERSPEVTATTDELLELRSALVGCSIN